jgi:hypothetical protein
MLRDPLAFVWRYALGWHPRNQDDQPLSLDARAFGDLVHELLKRTVDALEPQPGFGRAARHEIEDALTASVIATRAQWPLERSTPPSLLWQHTLEAAATRALAALTFDPGLLPGTRSWTEVPFGQSGIEAGADLPWDPNLPVQIPGTNIRIRGSIDRLDLRSAPDAVQVSDYKTGVEPKNASQIVFRGGAELQRVIYACATRQLLPEIIRVVARTEDEIEKYVPRDDLEAQQRRAAIVLSIREAQARSRLAPVRKIGATVTTIKATDGHAIPAGQYDLETNAEFIRLEVCGESWKFLTWRTRAPNLLSLNAVPTSSQILYHYCSRDVLWSIIEKGNIWLSDIFALNDSQELKWGRDSFVKVLLDNPELFDDDFRDFAIWMVFRTQQGARPFVGSFSANGDLLSQWRAYSVDGSGFSLGLRASHIFKKWGVRLKKIEYREAKQEAIIAQSLVELQDIWRMTGGVIVASDNHPGGNPDIFPGLKYPTPLFANVLLSNWLTWERILGKFAMDLSSPINA